MSAKIDYLSTCKKCKNRSFDMKRGIICSITNDQRIFLAEDECPDYLGDTLVIGNDKHKAVKKRREVILFLTVGGISTLIGVLTTIVLLFNNRISLWILGLILIGISLLIHGYNKHGNLKTTPKEGDLEILDDELN